MATRAPYAARVASWILASMPDRALEDGDFAIVVSET